MMIGETKVQDWLSALLASAIFALIFGLCLPLAGKIVVAKDTVSTVTLERCETTDMFFSMYDLYLYITANGYRIRTQEEISIGSIVDITLVDYYQGVFHGFEVHCAPLDQFQPLRGYLLTPTPFWAEPVVTP